MAINFNGDMRVIHLDGVTSTSAGELYSYWKRWVAGLLPQSDDGSHHYKAFDTVGGDPLGNNIFITPYFFLVNGWKIQPQSSNHTLHISDNLLTDDNSSPFIFPPGGYSIEVVRQFALKTETVNGTGDPFTQPLESSMTRDEALRTILSFASGVASGMNGPVTKFMSQDGSKPRITATLDANGNRTNVVVDGT